MEKKEKRRSLLSLILPVKSAEKGGKEFSSGNSTPKGSDDNLVDDAGKTKKQKSKTRSLDKKTKGKSSLARKDFDKTPTAETSNQDLAICSVFHTQATNRSSRTGFDMDPQIRTVPLAPKASGAYFLFHLQGLVNSFSFVLFDMPSDFIRWEGLKSVDS